MTSRSPFAFSLVLGIAAVSALTAGCGGGNSPMAAVPVATPTPFTATIASGGQFTVSGSKGVTFTFAVGAGVGAGETALVTALPPPQPCSGTGCTAVLPPLDGFQLSVGPQPLALGALTSVALAGVQSPFLVSMFVQDTTNGSAFTNFAYLPPTGGPITFAAPATVHPILTLAPNHTYAIGIYTTGIAPS